MVNIRTTFYNCCSTATCRANPAELEFLNFKFTSQFPFSIANANEEHTFRLTLNATLVMLR